MPSPFDGFPKSSAGRLTLFLIGPGYGESSVVSLPDGSLLVVDSACDGSTNLTLGLLRYLGAQRVDLLVLTHPDADHVNGMDEILGSFDVGRFWRYPRGRAVRDFLAQESRKDPTSRRLESLRDVHNAVIESVGAGMPVNDCDAGTPEWPPGGGAQYRVTSLAPTSFDSLRMEAQFDGLLTRRNDGDWGLAPRFAAALTGERPWHDRPNIVSGAVTIEWARIRILLSGDVETGSDHPGSGWKGILSELAPRGVEPDRRGLLRTATLVKLAHHGSRNGFWPGAWDLHAAAGAVPLTALTPFNRGDVGAGDNPPAEQTLGDVRARAERLLITSRQGEAQARARKAGWVSCPTARPVAGSAAVAAIVFAPDGIENVFVAGTAELFRSA